MGLVYRLIDHNCTISNSPVWRHELKVSLEPRGIHQEGAFVQVGLGINFNPLHSLQTPPAVDTYGQKSTRCILASCVPYNSSYLFPGARFAQIG